MSDYRIASAKDRFLIVLITLVGVPLTGAGIDIYVPSLPEITRYFHIDASAAQLSLTIYLIGYGVMTFFAGPLADRFGRRKILTFSTLLGTAFALIAAASPNIATLLLARFMQGASIAGLGVVNRSAFPDTFKGKTLRKMMPFVMTAWASGPILAPFIGGHLQHWFNWQACFYFLASYSFLLFLLSFIFPETLQHRHEFRFKIIKNNYWQIISSRLFLGWTLMAVIFYALLIVFAVVGPFLVEKVMHYTPVFYGNISLLIGIVWFLGSLIARALAHFHPNRVLPKLCFASIIFGVFILIYALVESLSIINLMVPTLILILIGAITFGFCFGASLSLFPQISGSNSAATGTFISLGAGIVSSLAVILKTTTDVPLFASFLGLFIVSSLLYFFTVRPIIQNSIE